MGDMLCFLQSDVKRRVYSSNHRAIGRVASTPRERCLASYAVVDRQNATISPHRKRSAGLKLLSSEMRSMVDSKKCASPWEPLTRTPDIDPYS